MANHNKHLVLKTQEDCREVHQKNWLIASHPSRPEASILQAKSLTRRLFYRIQEHIKNNTLM